MEQENEKRRGKVFQRLSFREKRKYRKKEEEFLVALSRTSKRKKKMESFQRPSFREKRKYRKKEEFPVTLSGTRKLFLFLIILFPIFLQILLHIL